MIHIFENFITEDECEKYLELGNRCSYTTGERENVWSNRIAYLLSIDMNHRGLLQRLQDKIRGVTGKELYADTFSLVRWRPGDVQLPHADGEEPDGSPHPYPWREYGSVLYFNDDYEGGELYFPGHELELKPKPGTFAFFPGTTEYLHGVREVEFGVRVTVGVFWTTDKTKRLQRFYDLNKDDK